MSAAGGIPCVLTVAGSDSGGGAGIQADLKTFTALGTHGMSAITALTAQNTVGVRGIHAVPPAFVALQLDTVIEDLRPAAVKTGMLANVALIETVAERLSAHGLENVVVDPVMVAESGDRLLEEDAVDALRMRLLPLAAVVTPNVAEAGALVGRELGDWDALKAAGREILAMGPKAVLLKGGHLPGDEAVDVLIDAAGGYREFRAPRVATRGAHGTGCTFAAGIAARLALGDDLPTAIERAKAYLTRAIREATQPGAGASVLRHGWPCDADTGRR
jgi:hydroxymethylpyrimidine/phosphomethylpyrimidine kinase